MLALMAAMVEVMYYPFDFGEGDDTSIELWFMSASTKEEAKEQTEFFISKNGYV